TASVPGLRDLHEGVRQVLPIDYDNDGDPDLLVITTSGHVQLFENLRQDRFRPIGEEWGRTMDNAWKAAVADVNHDGWFDILITGAPSSESALYLNRHGHFDRDNRIGLKLAGLSHAEPRFIDYDDNSWQDLLVAGDPA